MNVNGPSPKKTEVRLVTSQRQSPNEFKEYLKLLTRAHELYILSHKGLFSSGGDSDGQTTREFKKDLFTGDRELSEAGLGNDRKLIVLTNGDRIEINSNRKITFKPKEGASLIKGQIGKIEEVLQKELPEFATLSRQNVEKALAQVSQKIPSLSASFGKIGDIYTLA